MTIETPADGRGSVLQQLSEADRDHIAAFARKHSVVAFASENIEFDGWLTLWPPQSQCFEGQTGWLACEVKSFGAGWHEPREYEEEEIGEFDTLANALAALAERHRNFEQYAASADTHRNGEDATEIAAEFMSGAGPHEDAGDAQPSDPS